MKVYNKLVRDNIPDIILKDKNNLPDGLKSAFMGFYFDSFEISPSFLAVP